MTNTAKLSTIHASMVTPDADVVMPTKAYSACFLAQVMELQVGDSAVKSKRVDPSTTMADYMVNGSALREQLRNATSSSVRLATDRHGRKFEVEMVDVFTSKRVLHIMAVVTRTE